MAVSPTAAGRGAYKRNRLPPIPEQRALCEHGGAESSTGILAKGGPMSRTPKSRGGPRNFIAARGRATGAADTGSGGEADLVERVLPADPGQRLFVGEIEPQRSHR